MKIAIFDWTAGGHHPLYVRRFAEALRTSVDVAVAAPDATLVEVGDLEVETRPLEGSRPPEAPGRRQRRELARAELDLLESTVRDLRPDHVIHLYADEVLGALVRRPPLPVPVSIVFFYPRAHYPRAYASPLPASERIRGRAIEFLIRRWRRRPDAHAVFVLDGEAARIWQGRGGARAVWLPEPPVRSLPPGEPPPRREGCLLWGSLSRHKGISALARALSADPIDAKLTLAGTIRPEFNPELERYVDQMRMAGVDVEVVDAHDFTELEALRTLRRARCAVLPYPAHMGMSRVLLEACTVGTPVVATDYGLVGHLVREHSLGLAVRQGDSAGLRRAVVSLVEDDDAPGRYGPALRRFAEGYSTEKFQAAVTRPFREGARPGGREGRSLSRVHA